MGPDAHLHGDVQFDLASVDVDGESGAWHIAALVQSSDEEVRENGINTLNNWCFG